MKHPYQLAKDVFTNDEWAAIQQALSSEYPSAALYSNLELSAAEFMSALIKLRRSWNSDTGAYTYWLGACECLANFTIDIFIVHSIFLMNNYYTLGSKVSDEIEEERDTIEKCIDASLDLVRMCAHHVVTIIRTDDISGDEPEKILETAMKILTLSQKIFVRSDIMHMTFVSMLKHLLQERGAIWVSRNSVDQEAPAEDKSLELVPNCITVTVPSSNPVAVSVESKKANGEIAREKTDHPV